mmetsp:Transcript_13170/g.31485  ORF Transcript_13170/g.31485 Transcript_13170/m.31485 type:complete len:204 (-) Transcript_13170:15-626(-)
MTKVTKSSRTAERTNTNYFRQSIQPSPSQHGSSSSPTSRSTGSPHFPSLKEFKYDRLESENGILYQLEHSTKRIMRQLRRAVVPERLRPTIIAAYHSTPLAGHVGFHKTLYRIAARFWWPKMTKDIREAVLSCGHCTLGNATNHVRQKLYQPTSIAEPFEVCCMDIWFPGKCKTFRRNASPALLKTLDNKAVITYLCNTTGFA